MSRNHLLFVSILILITITIIMVNTKTIEIAGTVNEVTTYETHKTITLRNNHHIYTLFTKKQVSLEKGDNITLTITEDEYQHQTQYIIQKIIKS